ncbi:hypothetical protein NLG97_g5283 [Lecanicillium saksenae]|uniref:Uncharacterized protein n=1 Tax=Lecanicillium saksenae TaxID=468837 RepID=A0ACC1QWQ6_9HYPO|nr:hypothetical protein NLG97_g5283 [Lecanicillium saksenae]
MTKPSRRPLITALVASIASTIAAVPTSAQLPLTYHDGPSSFSRDPFTSEFGDYVDKLLEEWKVAGLAIGIVDSQQSYSKAYGYAQLPNVPATTDTLWYVGSTTKAQVVATLAQIIDNQTYPGLAQGWETPVSSIIRDDFVLGDEWATAHLTLEDAACHRTGLGGHGDAYPNTINGSLATSQDIVRLLRYFPLTYEPRTKWDYNNYMYTMLSHTVETLTGEPLRQTLKRVLWEPLGMSSTFLNLRDVNQSKHKVARGYFWDREQGKFGEHPLWDAPGVSGAGTELSTVKDYTKWLKCLIDESAPLSKGAHREIRKARMVVQPEMYPPQGFDMSMYGLAWFRSTIHGHVVYQHTGSTDSHGANVVWLPELNYGLVIFLNQPNEIRHVIARKLIEDRIGTPEAERFDVAGFWKEALEGAEKAIDNMIDILFPDRPTPALPSTHDLDAITGKYSHPGYGTLEVRLETNPENASEKILVADRDNLAFPVQWRFEHVSGDFWAVWRYGYVNTARPSLAYAAHVDTAASGTVKSFTLKMPEVVAGKDQLEIVFSRLDQV